MFHLSSNGVVGAIRRDPREGRLLSFWVKVMT